jgi:phospholipid transport system substrate-binding protein
MNIFKKILLLGIIASFNVGAYADSDMEDLQKYVQHVVDEGYSIVADKSLNLEQRKAKSALVIRDSLYLEWMAKYTLGRHRKDLAEEKLQEFIRAYSDYVVQAYADLSKNYNGQKLVFVNTRELDEDVFLVKTQIVNPKSTDSLKVDYLVHKTFKNGAKEYLIGDIITEGVSILNSQQSEFSNILAEQGVDALIANLKTKTAAKTSKK